MDADVEEIITATPCIIADGTKLILPHTSQSPAVKEILVTSVAVAEGMLTPGDEATEELTYSPTEPAAALSLVVVPIIPLVELNVILGTLLIALPVTRKVPEVDG